MSSIKKNKILVADWDYRHENKNTRPKTKDKKYYANHENNYSKIQYTADECAKEFYGDIAIWGRPWVEGIMLCQKLELEGIISIEILINPDTKQQIISYYLTTNSKYKQINEEVLKQLMGSKRVPIIINKQDNLHFVPLLLKESTSQSSSSSSSSSSGAIITTPSPNKKRGADTETSQKNPVKRARPDITYLPQEELESSCTKADEFLEGYNQKEEKTLLDRAIKLYKQAAENGYKAAQDKLVTLRDKGLYQNLDLEAMASYTEAIKGAMDDHFAKPAGKIKEFINHARNRRRDYERKYQERLKNKAPATPEKKGKKKSIKQTAEGRSHHPPMRISDLIVMDLDIFRTPKRIIWGGNPKQLPNAQYIYGPLFRDSKTLKYDFKVLAVDTSGSGGDETTYCVAKRRGDYYFIAEVGGLGGGYEDKTKDTKASVGNKESILDELVRLAIKHQINVITVETNKDPAFVRLLEKKLGPKQKEIKIETKHQSRNKEARINEVLQPLLKTHKLIISKEALINDFSSAPQDDLYFKFFYQLMALVEDNLSSGKYFDNGKLQHDDRIDVVASAMILLKEKSQNAPTKQTRKSYLRELKKEAKKGNIKAQLELGRNYKAGLGVEEDLDEAEKWLRIAAEKYDNPDAQFELAEILPSIKEDEKFNFYSKSASNGHVPAMYKLGETYSIGSELVAKDENEAIRWYTEAASKGHAAAAYALAKIYLNGSATIRQDKKEAWRWCEIAVKLGHPKAMYKVAQKHEQDKNDIEAFKWYLKAAKNNYAKAQFLVGSKYDEGKGVAQDYQEAFVWYEKAAQSDEPRAQYGLAQIYWQGRVHNRQDKEKAIFWFHKAAEQGYVEAQFILGNIFQEQNDYKKATVWYKRAADEQHKLAIFSLGTIYEEEKKYKEAFECYKEASELDLAEANNKIGHFYHHGWGVEQDRKMAYYFFTKTNT
ncbi:sel1 repeat protein [Candidatus Amoebophilus asiaticus 5a2]|uniref:Sel1 repeat protein n=1 Tax=Amoebophilus asiaticus (strain 5a2) TaxID=452471 RepID=C3L3T6_AMOA5|nr:SEL1-like repeat protein [Candidatus Amoebophilus asiaticus]ACP20977.1 sel1 repeat protein [Candidatus Amoebophilus asiaticus 5a2]